MRRHPIRPRRRTPGRRILTFSVLVLAAVAAPGGILADVPEPAPSTSEEVTRAGVAAAASPDAVGAGKLLRRCGETWVPLPVATIDVDLRVHGLIVRGRVSQVFDNPTGDVIEALYVFPLPDRAAVHRMEMRIGERRIASTIREKQEARETYERARAGGKKAALLDQRRPNLFTTAVANINPGESVRVELEYFEELTATEDGFELSFPLTYTPRFTPRGNEARPPAPHDDGGENADSIPVPTFARAGEPAAPRATLVVELDLGTEVDDVVSPSHRVEVRERDGRVLVRPRGQTVAADRDFQLSWKPRLGGTPRAALFVEEWKRERYGLLMLWPPLPESDRGLGLPTETLFVVDVSGSMEGRSIDQARRALLAALGRLRAEDRFNLMSFNDGHAEFASEFRQAVPQEIDAARTWVRGLRAGGGTMIYPALMRALALAGESRSAHGQRIVFLTDGAVGNEQEVLRAIHERLGDVRLHALGIGSAPNKYLMRKIAEQGHGICEFIADAGEAENRIGEFFSRLERPVMTDVELTWSGLEVSEVYPERLPDLHAGEPLLVSLKLDGATTGGSVRLEGFTRLGPLETSATFADVGPSASGISARWARAKIDWIMDELHAGTDPELVRTDVVELALEHELVTRYTSLVAVDESPSALGRARPVSVAATLPQGGSRGPLVRRVGAGACLAGLILLGWARFAGRFRLFGAG